MATDQDRIHLRRALELAAGGRGRVSPNPMVGAVVVRDGQVVGEGFHAELGGPHAEVAAIEDCARPRDRPGRGDPVRDARAVRAPGPPASVRRRDPRAPASHAWSSPPTTRARRRAARGPRILRDAGCRRRVRRRRRRPHAARLLNQPFRKHARTGRPLVVAEVRRHARRPGGHRRRRLEVDLERGEPPAGAPLARRGRRRRASGSAPRSPTIRC